MYELIMKKIGLFIIAVVLGIAGQCLGQWKYNDFTDNDTYYIDYSRIKTEGRYKSLWYLRDPKTPQTNGSGKQYKSSAVKVLIDCQGSRTQIIAIFQYKEQMGGGAVVDSYNFKMKETEWENTPPNSINDGFIKAACAQNPPQVIAPVMPKPPVINTQDIKRQKCITLGLTPGSADFQQCMN